MFWFGGDIARNRKQDSLFGVLATGCIYLERPGEVSNSNLAVLLKECPPKHNVILQLLLEMVFLRVKVIFQQVIRTQLGPVLFS